ncbi:MAG: zinc-finger domain-containing protein [Gammaproteobacteria bacterium]|nr:zinc-finger domain-containing protein [Gammaproteobacteria bacterium]NNC97526.1 zinc-finger domain-containing protein [Gammaproteobacteria bacterium]NNM14242.1 zinc-finger domain-containing protein [Gammaproteobacteria bacterium]
MTEKTSSNINPELSTPNAQDEYTVSKADLPLHCPTPGMSKWNSHPKVFIPVEDTGEARCPYCGAMYYLKS